MEDFFKKGLEFHQKGNFKEAKRCYEISLSENPSHFSTLNHLGILLAQNGSLNLSLDFFKKAIIAKPNDASTYSNLGNIYLQLKQIQEAINNYNKAIELKPNVAEFYSNLGNALKEYRHRNYLKQALIAFDKAISLDDNFFPAHNNQGNVLQELREFDAANISYKKAIKINPDYLIAYNNLGDNLLKLNKPYEAMKCFEKGISINPDYQFLYGKYLYAKMLICDWDNYYENKKKIEEKISSHQLAAYPLTSLCLTDKVELHLIAAQSYVKFLYPLKKNLNKIRKINSKIKISIGYFSSDFLEHPVSYLINQVIELHDRKKFEIVAFSLFKKNNSDMRKKLISLFDKFIDIEDKSDEEIANLVRDLKIDIVIDLNGHTAYNRFGIFSMRIAPIQVNFLGYTGTTGSNCIDYIISDMTSIPKELQKNYSEKICYLPNSYLPFSTNLKKSSIKFTRFDLKLPKNSFVFSSFNNSFKITPDVFLSWIRILKTVDNSVLWLAKNNEHSFKNLTKELLKKKIDLKRIIFSDRLVSYEDHLERQKSADLLLDTYPYGGHTTTINALWAGLPVLTLSGKSFASRVSASLLSAIGLPELITYSKEEYEAKAIELAINQEKFCKIKKKLNENRLVMPLFDNIKFTRSLELAYIKMHERYESNLDPENIYV